MPFFVYIGGNTHSESVSETSDERGRPVVVDERDGTEMPDSTTAFGLKFIVGQPVDVRQEAFPNPGAYQHALKKLRANQFFKPFAEDVAFEEVKPEPAPVAERKKPGPKPKPAEAPEPVDVE